MNLEPLKNDIETAYAEWFHDEPEPVYVREIAAGRFRLVRKPIGKCRLVKFFTNDVRLDELQKRVFDTLHAMRCV